MKGRTIPIYCVDGVPTGVLTAEIINGAGRVIVAARSQLAILAMVAEIGFDDSRLSAADLIGEPATKKRRR